MNHEIDCALNEYASKSGGTGDNRPDAKLLVETKTLGKWPILINYKHMDILISAIQKLVIKDVILSAQEKERLTIKIVEQL